MGGRMVKTTKRPAKGKGKSAGGSSRATPRRESRFDLTPGTHVDEYLAPWLLAYLVVPVVGVLAHWGWGHGVWQWAMPPVLVAVGAVLAAVAWHDAAARKVLIRIRVCVSAFAALASVAVSTVVGVVHVSLGGDPPTLHVDWVRPWLDMQLVLGAVIALSWNILRTDAVRGTGEDHHEQRRTGWDELAGLPGSSVSDITHNGDITTGTIHTAAPQDTDDVQQAGRAIRAITRAAGVTIVPHPSGDPTKARLSLVRRDVLRKPTPWPGPSHPGGSIVDYVRTGMVENGTESRLHIANDTDGRAPFLAAVAGMPGSGKSRFAWVLWADGASRRDVVWWVSDTAKSGQTSGPARGLFDWTARTTAETQAMLASVERMATWRADYLGEDLKMQEWSPASGIPYVVVWFEEAARIADKFAERIIRLSELVRSTGITLVFSMQRLSATNMPTDARHNLGAGVCFGTGDDISASFVLSDSTLDAGANPHKWKANKPAYHFMEAPGVPEDEWPLRRRTYNITPEVLAGAVRDGERYRARGLDVGSAAAAGPAYASRDGAASRPPVPMQRPVSRTASGLLVPGHAPDSVRGVRELSVPDGASRPATAGFDLSETDDQDDHDETDADVDAAILEEDMAMAREALEPLPPEVAELAARGPVQPGEYPESEDFELGGVIPDPPPGARLSIEEQGVHVRQMISDLMGDRNGMEIDTADLVDAWHDLREQVPGIPQRPALYRWLERLTAEGLAEDRGRGRWFLHRGAAATTVTLTDRDEEGGDTGVLSTIAV